MAGRGEFRSFYCPCFSKQNRFSLVAQELVYKSIHVQFKQQGWKVFKREDRKVCFEEIHCKALLLLAWAGCDLFQRRAAFCVIRLKHASLL